MLNKIVDWLVNRAYRTPYMHIGDYMRRWWLVPYNRFVPAVRIHEILRSDDDRAFHDHPWPYLSFVLRGGYWEVRPIYDRSGVYCGNSRRWYGSGRVILRRANSWHRLEVPTGTIATTLFITGRYRNKWGFLPNPKTKVIYTEYLDL